MSYNSKWTGPQIDDAVGKALASAKQTDLTSIIATGSKNATGSTIASGTYFYLKGTLVRAKANIASGATFTSSNYEAVTAGGLNELKAALDGFGITSTIRLNSSDDLNNIVVGGFYSWSDSSAPANVPPNYGGTYCKMIVISRSYNEVMQIVIPSRGQYGIYLRGMYGAWAESWYHIPAIT